MTERGREGERMERKSERGREGGRIERNRGLKQKNTGSI